MIEYIYNKKLVFKDASLGFLASLYYLAEKYNMEDLRDEIFAFIPKYKITRDNFLEAALFAEDNLVHQELSEALYEAVDRFVRMNKGVVNDLYIDVNEEHAVVIFKIIKRSNAVKVKYSQEKRRGESEMKVDQDEQDKREQDEREQMEQDEREQDEQDEQDEREQYEQHEQDEQDEREQYEREQHAREQHEQYEQYEQEQYEREQYEQDEQDGCEQYEQDEREQMD